MKSTDLTREQTDKLLAEVTPMLGYLSRLSARMDKRGMGTDRLAADVGNARQPMQTRRMRLRYLHCEGLGNHANVRSTVAGPRPAPIPAARRAKP